MEGDARTKRQLEVLQNAVTNTVSPYRLRYPHRMIYNVEANSGSVSTQCLPDSPCRTRPSKTESVVDTTQLGRFVVGLSGIGVTVGRFK
jgi:hypothetical protein